MGVFLVFTNRESCPGNRLYQRKHADQPHQQRSTAVVLGAAGENVAQSSLIEPVADLSIGDRTAKGGNPTRDLAGHVRIGQADGGQHLAA